MIDAKLILVIVLLCPLNLFCDNEQWNGTDYNKHSSEQRYAASFWIDNLKFNGNEHILDVGCGDGYNTHLLALKASQGMVLGTDKSLSMIAFAKEHFTDDHLQFELISVEKLDFHEQFDWVVSFTVFHWVRDASIALQNIYQSLKPHGKLLLEIPFKAVEGVHPLHQAARDVVALPDWKNYFVDFDPGWYFRTKEEYENLLHETLFQQVKLETYLVPNTFNTRELFIESIKQWFPYLLPLPSDLKDVFVNALIDRYLELVPLSEKGISFDVYRILITAEKSLD